MIRARRNEVHTERGVTLLIAFLSMTMAFSLATGIFTLLFSEFQLAAQESDSIKAFYAANTGLECARYWDTRRGDNPGKSGNQANYLAFNRGNADISNRWIHCNGQIKNLDDDGNGGNRTFDFVLDTAEGCADIFVRKDTNGQTLVTTILSRGRMRAGAGCSITDRVVERALEFTYTERLP